jgi:acetyl esterase/lipase
MRRFVRLVAAAAALAVTSQPVLFSAPAEAAVPVAAAATAAPRVASVKTYSYGATMEQTYDVYRSTSSGRRPTVVIVHGGGWVEGDKKDRTHRVQAQRLVAAGYTAISVNYRLVKNGVTLNQSVADVSAALDHLRARAATLGVDKSRIAVIGSSAGGHLAMMLGTMGRGQDRVRAVVASAGMPALQLQNEESRFGRGKAGWLRGRSSPQAGMTKKQWYAQVDPYANAGAGDAPLLWLGASGDTYVHPELPWRMAARLEWTGVSAKVVVADDVAHGLWAGNYAHRDRGWWLTLRWIDAKLRGGWSPGSKVSATTTVKQSGSSLAVRSSAETDDTADSAPFGAAYRIYVARRSGTKLQKYTLARRGRFSSARTGKAGFATLSATLPRVPAGSRVQLQIDGNGARTTRTFTVR